MVIGVTGGIGSGKSAVCGFLSDMGIPVIDADKLGHEALRDKKIIGDLINRFGCDIIDKGAVNKSALAERAFSSAEARAALDDITHPYIIKKIREKIVLYSAKYDIIALELPLLYECGLGYLCDEVWVVYAPEDVRQARLLKRGMSPEDVRNRMRLQMSLEEKARLADFVIDNSAEGFSSGEEIAGRIDFYKR
ncbi:MAG: dephospho-CoA kinase [Abditibacteriota bacterium]|nr:dephospho-CoA kinase [Abditibacteriota bacterium]